MGRAGVESCAVAEHSGRAVAGRDNGMRFADEAKKYFSGQVVVAKDLMEF
jgi:hypothetical protein